MIEVNCDQGTDEWHDLRLGIPSASRFKDIVTSKGVRTTGRSGPSPRDKYLYELAGEKLSGERMQHFKSSSMQKGNDREDESRLHYSIMNNIEIRQTGFIFYDEKMEFGCSPDGIIVAPVEEEGWESKNKESHVQLRQHIHGWSKTEHYQQVQGSLYVTGFKRWHLTSYSRGIEPISYVFERDEEFIRKLALELNMFIHDLKKLVNQYKI